MASTASNDDLDALAPAWREFQTRTPVKLRTVENERHYRAMVGLMNKLIDEIGDRETHPLMGLLDIVTFFVRDYEERNVEIPNAEPPANAPRAEREWLSHPPRRSRCRSGDLSPRRRNRYAVP
jgi:hypothetical protein